MYNQKQGVRPLESTPVCASKFLKKRYFYFLKSICKATVIQNKTNFKQNALLLHLYLNSSPTAVIYKIAPY